jgi:hypothetical protein
MVKKFWKLAVYKTDRTFGGSEEGGWYYQSGERLKEGKTKFTSKAKAIHACYLFNKFYGNTWNTFQYGKICDVFYRGTPEQIPTKKPIYC